MNRLFVSLLGALLICVFGAQAQQISPRQVKQHLRQTEQSLIAALSHSESPNVQATAAQTIRELEYMLPDEPFTELIAPLTGLVKDETADTRVRFLAAIALDGLHSDDGDAVIATVAQSSGNKSMVELCGALMVKASNK